MTNQPSTPRTAERVSIDELIEDARTFVVPGERRVLGITGAPGAGKSTVAERIVAALGTDAAALVPMDGFHLANEVLDALGRRDRKGAHDTFDDVGYSRFLAGIRSQPHSPLGRTHFAPRFRREIEEPIGSSIPIRPATPLVVTEGNYLLLESGCWPEAMAQCDQVWYVEIDDEVRRDRLVRRHEAYGKSHEDAERWARGSDQRNAELIAATAYRADRILRLVG